MVHQSWCATTPLEDGNMSLETTEICSAISYRRLRKHRPRAWHNDPALRARLGLEDNHYDEPIPYQEVVRRLF